MLSLSSQILVTCREQDCDFICGRRKVSVSTDLCCDVCITVAVEAVGEATQAAAVAAERTVAAGVLESPLLCRPLLHLVCIQVRDSPGNVPHIYFVAIHGL